MGGGEQLRRGSPTSPRQGGEHVPEQQALTVGESHHQPDGVGGVGMPVEDAAGPLQREGGCGEFPRQRRGGHVGHVGQQGWGSR